MTSVSFPAPAQPPASLADEVEADGFYPDLSLRAAREGMRLPPQVTDTRLRDALLDGLIAVRRELADRAWEWRQAGAATLAGVPSDPIGDRTELELLYFRAVHAHAAAELIESHHDISATVEGRDRNELRALGSADLRASFTKAIRAMRGETGVVSELI